MWVWVRPTPQFGNFPHIFSEGVPNLVRSTICSELRQYDSNCDTNSDCKLYQCIAVQSQIHLDSKTSITQYFTNIPKTNHSTRPKVQI